jgi:hypothetical protein
LIVVFDVKSSSGAMSHLPRNVGRSRTRVLAYTIDGALRRDGASIAPFRYEIPPRAGTDLDAGIR